MILGWATARPKSAMWFSPELLQGNSTAEGFSLSLYTQDVSGRHVTSVFTYKLIA